MNRSPPYKKIPVYTNTFQFADGNNELPQYNASLEANIACKDAIETAIRKNYSQNRLHVSIAVPHVIRQFGFERTFYVLANTIQEKEWDGRFSRDNKAWSLTIPVLKEPGTSQRFIVDKVSPGLVDMFVCEARHEHLLTQPLKAADVRKEASRILSELQCPKEPNSPNGTHFMVQVSPDFMRRAKTRDTGRLFDLLPFESLSLSTLNGRKGVYALISKDENRDQDLRQRKPSVRKQLQTKQTDTHEPPAPGKTKSQER